MQQLFDLFGTLAKPTGMIMAVVALALLVIAIVSPKSRWWLMALLMYCSSLFPVDSKYGDVVNNYLIPPLGQMHIYSRSLCALLLVALIFITMGTTRGWRWSIMSAPAVMFFVYEMVVSLRALLAGDPFRGIFGAATYILIFLVFVVGLGRWLQDIPDAISALRCSAWTGIILVIASLAQGSVHPGTVFAAGRFRGTTGNANQAAVMLCCTLLPCVFLLTQKAMSRRWFMWQAAAACAMVIALLWTGSRTGLVMAICGAVLFFRRNLRGFTVIAIVGGGLVFLVVSTLFPDAIPLIGRIVQTTDTRTGSWVHMINQFLANPAMGAWGQGSNTESSYLLVAARSGIMGLIPFVICIFLIALSVMRLWSVRDSLGEAAPLADLVIAGIGSIAVGAVGEGFLFGIYTVPVFAVYIYLALMAFLLDYAAANPDPQGLTLFAEEMTVDPEAWAGYR